MNHYIEIKDLVKNYFNNGNILPVLTGVNLTVSEGEILIITGMSGAGKSTLLNVLGTLDHFDDGEIILDNHVYSKMSEKDKEIFRRYHLGFVFQFHHLLPDFTAFENVLLPQIIIGKNKKEAEKNAQSIMERVNIWHRKDHRPSQLSGGEQQRVSIARSLVNNPKIVLADEPSGNLDEKSSIELHNLIYELNQEYKKTFIIVSHDVDLWDNNCRFVKIHEGKII